MSHSIAELITKYFDLRPAAFGEYLKLRRLIYTQTAAYGHFGRDEADFTCKVTDRAAALRKGSALAAARN